MIINIGRGVQSLFTIEKQIAPGATTNFKLRL